MSNLTDFIGGTSGGGGLNPLTISSQVFTASGTFVAPQAGKYIVIIQGGGGSGGYADSSIQLGQGGGGGFISHGIITLTDAENVVVTIGSGGASKTSAMIGDTGGTTSFGAYLTANGGEGGAYGATDIAYSQSIGGSKGGLIQQKSSTTGGDGRSAVSIEAEDIFLNFYNILQVTNRGGANRLSLMQNATVILASSGGGAGLGGDGGDAQNVVNGNSTAKGAGAGGGGGSSEPSGAGGDGIVYIFWEAV